MTNAESQALHRKRTKNRLATCEAALRKVVSLKNEAGMSDKDRMLAMAATAEKALPRDSKKKPV